MTLKKMTEEKNNEELMDQETADEKVTEDQAAIEEDAAELASWLQDRQLAIQPTLIINQFGIKPNAQLVRYTENEEETGADTEE
jgi:hypothetical protein